MHRLRYNRPIMEHTRTAIVPIRLMGAAYRQAHAACHQAAALWNQAVDFLHAEWRVGRDPSRYDGTVKGLV